MSAKKHRVDSEGFQNRGTRNFKFAFLKTRSMFLRHRSRAWSRGLSNLSLFQDVVQGLRWNELVCG